MPNGDVPFENKRHFFGAAAKAMRRIRVESARNLARIKRGGRIGRDGGREQLAGRLSPIADDGSDPSPKERHADRLSPIADEVGDPRGQRAGRPSPIAQEGGGAGNQQRTADLEVGDPRGQRAGRPSPIAQEGGGAGNQQQTADLEGGDPKADNADLEVGDPRGSRHPRGYSAGGRTYRRPAVAAPFEEPAVFDQDPSEVLAVADALDNLEQFDRLKADVVNLRYFSGFTVKETAEALGISPRKVNLEWRMARAWLYRELGGTDTVFENDDS
jgi:hypothetical protein